jgi:DNA-binding MarR family transcriptional regulator
MESSHDMDGARFARLVLETFDSMVGEVMHGLTRAGHPGLTAANEFAMQAIDGGADSAADLARALGVSRQAAAKTIATLESLGYLDRAADETDARRKHLVVTDRGHEAIAIGAAAFSALHRRWLAEVGTADAAVTVEALRAMTRVSVVAG